MAKLRTYTQEDLARSYTPLSSTGVGAKGSQSNPYTESEMNEMIDNGTWTGGFVVGLGYVAAEHTVTGKPSSGSASDWRCPNCDVPYPPDGSMKCSNCGTELSYGSGSSSSSGGGGGGGTSDDGIPTTGTPIADVIPTSAFSGYKESDKEGCLRRCNEMLKTVGVETCASWEQSIFVTEKTSSGRAGAATSSVKTGINLIDKTLESGKPIVVGVDYKIDSPNNDDVTDHFVVIVGRDYSANGAVQYHYYDPGTAHKAPGTSKDNILTLGTDNRLTGHFKQGNKDYIVTTVRPNK